MRLVQGPQFKKPHIRRHPVPPRMPEPRRMSEDSEKELGWIGGSSLQTFGETAINTTGMQLECGVWSSIKHDLDQHGERYGYLSGIEQVLFLQK